jgi:RNA polymerase sigma-70 factor (sigma-E family)
VRVAEPDGFRDFVASRSRPLLRSAWLLTGDWALAEDLVQATLAKSWLRWGRITRSDAPEAYVRRVMVTTYLSWTRRRWRGELSARDMPEVVTPTDLTADADLRESVRVELARLTARQRAVLVLRYFDDLTEVQAAEALGCSVGTVKSQTSKALARLRESPAVGALLYDTELDTELDSEVTHDAN